MNIPRYTRTGLTGLSAICSAAFSRKAGSEDSAGRSKGLEPTLISIDILPIDTEFVLPRLSFRSVVLIVFCTPSNPSIAFPTV